MLTQHARICIAKQFLNIKRNNPRGIMINAFKCLAKNTFWKRNAFHIVTSYDDATHAQYSMNENKYR